MREVEVLALKEVEKNQCRLVMKGEGKLRAFLITLMADDDFPFFYKLNQVDEVELEEE